MEILLIGGTRNVGHLLVLELLRNGHEVTIFNRGITKDELPAEVRRLRGDRSDPVLLTQALGGKSFDVVIDTALYTGTDAQNSIHLLDGRVGRYIFFSTGQVYLIREESPRPFPEEAIEQPLLPPPSSGTRDYEEWLYGYEKSRAEDFLLRAWQSRGFPFTTLRLPMVNSERDHFQRVYSYYLRLQDGGPILLPLGKHLRLRHVFAEDVVQAVLKLMHTDAGKGCSYNISQDETVSIEDFLSLLAEIAGLQLQVKYAPRETLEHHGLFPVCSPFSDPWMSELDNQRSKQELGMQYTALPIYLKKLVAYYRENRIPLPAGYLRRGEEIRLAREL